MSPNKPSQKDLLPAPPPFSSLPLDPAGPPGNAWGRYGPTDQLGTLNLLTPAVVAAAAKEVVSGIRISLDWPLNEPRYSCHGRDPMRHEIKRRGAPDRVVNDDIIRFNTQCSSQWDGFRHYAWASTGGIIGRGILLDYASWATKHSLPLTPLSSTAIPFSHLQHVITEQSVCVRPGDILLIRCGFTAAFNALSEAEQLALSKRQSADFLGVEPSVEILEWLWERQIAAVAGDSPAFERSPVGKGVNETEGALPVVLHQWLLGGWGMPIGEMFDLEELAKHCRECGRWSFVLSSIPLKVPGGVASPPNAVAIF